MLDGDIGGVCGVGFGAGDAVGTVAMCWSGVRLRVGDGVGDVATVDAC